MDKFIFVIICNIFCISYGEVELEYMYDPCLSDTMTVTCASSTPTAGSDILITKEGTVKLISCFSPADNVQVLDCEPDEGFASIAVHNVTEQENGDWACDYSSDGVEIEINNIGDPNYAEILDTSSTDEAICETCGITDSLEFIFFNQDGNIIDESKFSNAHPVITGDSCVLPGWSNAFIQRKKITPSPCREGNDNFGIQCAVKLKTSSASCTGVMSALEVIPVSNHECGNWALVGGCTLAVAVLLLVFVVGVVIYFKNYKSKSNVVQVAPGDKYDLETATENKHSMDDHTKTTTVRPDHSDKAVPGPPTDVANSRLTSSSVVISWKPPKPTSEAKIRHFLVQVQGPFEDEWESLGKISGHQFSYQLLKLDPHTEYNVRVVAKNSFGWGEFCQPISFTTSDPSFI